MTQMILNIQARTMVRMINRRDAVDENAPAIAIPNKFVNSNTMLARKVNAGLKDQIIDANARPVITRIGLHRYTVARTSREVKTIPMARTPQSKFPASKNRELLYC